ncbi:MAG: phytanoyl-CoA dioxygenase family protein [Planctomycetota bacterium]|jgi:hypothetical protein|nr:phytanoyl-CoA dioxygenase family protein [Planctomycetota bacterium]
MAMTAMNTSNGFIRSSLAMAAELRERAARDGYLFLPGLLPDTTIASVRDAVCTELVSAGWADPDDPTRARTHVRGTCILAPELGFLDIYRTIYRQRPFHELPHHPRLIAALTQVLGEPVLPHPRHILRVQTPGSARWSTPPHQDHHHIRGTTNTWTAWIPLTDCSEGLGGLAVQPGSHRLGNLPVHQADGAGGCAVTPTDLPWHRGSFTAGDVLLLHSLCVHQAQDNITTDRFRLSLDCRYQHAGEPIHAASLEPHEGLAQWEEIYAGWDKNAATRYYWRDHAINVVDADFDLER